MDTENNDQILSILLWQVHRFCMVSVVTLAVIAYIVIIIHVGGYIKPEVSAIKTKCNIV